MSITDTNQDITQEQHDAIVDRLHFPREEGWEHGIRHFADLKPSDLDAIRAIAPWLRRRRAMERLRGHQVASAAAR